MRQAFQAWRGVSPPVSASRAATLNTRSSARSALCRRGQYSTAGAGVEDLAEAFSLEAWPRHVVDPVLRPGGAAQLLGINPGTLYSRLRKIGIRRP